MPLLPVHQPKVLFLHYITDSPSEYFYLTFLFQIVGCSPLSNTSPDGSLASQPSPPIPATPVTAAMNPLATIGFQNGTLIQTPVTTAGNSVAVVNNFQSVLQQVVQQQAESKPVVTLIKSASDLIESMKPPTAPTTFSTIAIQNEKPVVTNAIPIDLQFPTQDLPTTEAPTMTTVNNPFQTSEPQINCVSIPQMMNGMGMTGPIPTAATSPSGISTAIPVTTPQQQQNSTVVTTGMVIQAGISPASAPVAVSSLSVADCLGQAIIKEEPPPAINTGLRLVMSNNVTSAVVPSALPPGTAPPPTTVMGLMGGGDLQPHQGTIANALSQMSDNELINYINPNCFDGPLL